MKEIDQLRQDSIELKNIYIRRAIMLLKQIEEEETSIRAWDCICKALILLDEEEG